MINAAFDDRAQPTTAMGPGLAVVVTTPSVRHHVPVSDCPARFVRHLADQLL